MTPRPMETWRDRAVINVATAAVVFGRSQSWIRDRVDDGGLIADRSGRVMLITTDSVDRLMRRLVARAATRSPSASPARRLRLVVDNT